MDSYYAQQSGTGVGGFSGIRYQKGDGFFGRLISGTVLPLIKKMLPYLGKTALNTGIDIVRDVSQGEKIGSSVKRRLRDTAEHLSDKAMAKVKEFTGSGSKRRRKSNKRKKKSSVKSNLRRKPSVTKSKKKKKQRVTKNRTKRKCRKAVDFL